MTRDELDALILGHLAGTLSIDETRTLQARLDAHPEDAARLVELSDEELLFRQAFRAPVRSETKRTRVRRPLPRPASSPAWGVAAVAALALAALIGLATRSGPGPEEIARATNARRAQAERRALDEILRIESERRDAEARLEELRRKPPAPPEERKIVESEIARTEAFLERSRAEEQEVREELAPATHETRVAAMLAESVEGDAFAVLDGVKRKLRGGQPLDFGQGLEVAGPRGRLVVSFPDGTRFELSQNGAVKELQEDAGGKRIVVARGRVSAEITPQATGRAMLFVTPHAEARVLGTSISLSVDGATRLEVRHGKVRFAKPNNPKTVEVSGGEYSLAVDGKELAVAKIDALWRLVEGNEETTSWTPTGIDPISVGVSGEQAAGGRRSLRLSYAWRDPAKGGKGWSIVQHPFKPGPGEAWLSFRVYIQSCDETVKLGAMTWLDDEGAWHLGDVRLDKCPKQTWFTFAVPLRAGAKKNNPKGGTTYDADRVAGFGLSLVGGSATVYVDDVTASAEAPPAARGPKR